MQADDRMSHHQQSKYITKEHLESLSKDLRAAVCFPRVQIKVHLRSPPFAEGWCQFGTVWGIQGILAWLVEFYDK